MLALGLALAVCASVALNVSFLLQHAGSHHAPAISLRRPLAAARALLRSRLWLAGGAAGLLGSVLHLAALSQAPLFLVQAFSAGGLVITVPAAARWLGQRLERTDVLSVVALAAGLVGLGVGAGAAVPAHDAVPATALSAALLGTAVAAGAVASRVRGAVGLAACGGLLYGAADAAVKAATLVAQGGVGPLLASPWPYAALVLALTALLSFQRGLQIGPAVPVIAVATGATTLTTTLIGLLAFRESLGATPTVALLHLLALAVAVLAGLRLVVRQTALAPAGT